MIEEFKNCYHWNKKWNTDYIILLNIKSVVVFTMQIK